MSRSVLLPPNLFLYGGVPLAAPSTGRHSGLTRVGEFVATEDDIDLIANALLDASVYLLQSDCPDDVALGDWCVSVAAALWANAAVQAGDEP